MNSYQKRNRDQNIPVAIKVTQVLHSKNLTHSKYQRLEKMAGQLGKVRHQVWDLYGSKSGFFVDHRKIRDQWVAEKREFGVQSRLWKATLQDVCGDINAHNAAGMQVVAKKLYRRFGPEEGKIRSKKIKEGCYESDPITHRFVRNNLKRGRTWVSNQIVLDSGCYSCFSHNGNTWIEVMSDIPGKRIAIPLNTTHPVSGTIRLILKDGQIEVCQTIERKPLTSEKTQKLGIDKGYTEVFTDSEGQQYGQNFGELQSKESDYLKKKYQNRNKLLAIAKKKPHKAKNIQKHNLGRKKLDRRKSRKEKQLMTEIFTASHQVARQASVIVHEDLSLPMKSRKTFGKNLTRRLNAWSKGVMQRSLESVSQRYGVPLVAVNPCFTSQGDSRYGCALIGNRVGDLFYCFDGVVLQSDHNAARNILIRSEDKEIPLWMSVQNVKSILLERVKYIPGASLLTSGQPVGQ